MMDAHVAMQRVLRHLPQYVGQAPEKYCGCHQFVNWCSAQPDKVTTRMRHVFTCLKIKHFSKEDTRLSDSLRPRHEQRQARCRRDARKASKKKSCGLLVPDNHDIHHIDHNACNNHCGNLRVMHVRDHRKYHRTQGASMCPQLSDDFYRMHRKYYS